MSTPIKRHTIRDPRPELVLKPIGFIRTGMSNKFDAPHQPDSSRSMTAVIELKPNLDLHKALEDLEGFDRIWLIFWFHRNLTWKPKVLPPRGASKKRGVFATRSPHRPNPIGLSAVPLLGIDGRTITVGSCDLVDGTPILDIKPYIPAVDSFPDAQIGWLRTVEESFAEPPAYKVKNAGDAKKQIDWLLTRGINFIDRATELLERDPSPNRTRRIKKIAPDLYRMGCAEWRLFFTVTGRMVELKYVQPGYPLSRLKAEGSSVIPNRDEQLEFLAKWPPTGRYRLSNIPD